MNIDKELYNEIGKNIKKRRKKLGLTQDKLAEITNYSPSFIANIESNTYQSFSINALYNIAKALNTNMINLLPKYGIEHLNKEIKCEYCHKKIELPIEIMKLIVNISEITNKKLKMTCPKCHKSIYFKA